LGTNKWRTGKQAAAGKTCRKQAPQGWPVGTFVRGVRVMWEGEILGSASGEPVRFS
jgi:dihydroorotase